MTSHSETRITAVLLFLLHISTIEPAKTIARPVHEIINEQARIDEKIRLETPGSLPYGNPLAGNSQKNARLHAQNQQAMFNAERVRQHRAQLQRWNKQPQQIDSYMRAYHESQESHQLALEQQQANLRDKKTSNPTPKPNTKSRGSIRGSTLISGVKVIPEVIKLTKADAVKEKSRNHRSHGSVDFKHQQFLEPKAYKTVFLSPGPTYDQGVTIKPNGNVGLATEKPVSEDLKLYTEAIPSKTRYVYPKQYSQMQSYESAKDIEALNSLLKKTPQVQMSELNALLNSGNTEAKDVLETPIDLYFYVKDPIQTPPKHYDETYAQIPPTYASAYMPEIKDHTPITEEVDDIENPNKDPKVKPYGLKPILATQVLETTTTKSNNYYKVEVASQVISSGYNPELKPEYEEEKDYKSYAQPLVYYLKKEPSEGDLSQRYLHHNSQHKGVQHLSEDGSGTSAYGEDVSNEANTKKRAKRAPSNIEKVISLTEKPLDTQNNTPKAEPLITIGPIPNTRKEIETFLTTPNFPIGVATDYNNNFDYEEPPQHQKRFNRNKFEYTYDDEEYNEYGEDFVNPEYDYGNANPKPLLPYNNPRQNYAPTIGYNQNVDLTTSFSNKYGNVKRYPQLSGNFRGLHGPQTFGEPLHTPSTSYGVPQSYHNTVSSSQDYGVPLRYGVPNVAHINNIIEPVYMLTESQLKNLIGQHTHIQHLDVFQYPYNRYPRSKPRTKKRYPHRPSNAKKHLHKLHKLNIL